MVNNKLYILLLCAMSMGQILPSDEYQIEIPDGSEIRVEIARKLSDTNAEEKIKNYIESTQAEVKKILARMRSELQDLKQRKQFFINQLSFDSVHDQIAKYLMNAESELPKIQDAGSEILKSITSWNNPQGFVTNVTRVREHQGYLDTINENLAGIDNSFKTIENLYEMSQDKIHDLVGEDQATKADNEAKARRKQEEKEAVEREKRDQLDRQKTKSKEIGKNAAEKGLARIAAQERKEREALEALIQETNNFRILRDDTGNTAAKLQRLVEDILSNASDYPETLISRANEVKDRSLAMIAHFNNSINQIDNLLQAADVIVARVRAPGGNLAELDEARAQKIQAAKIYSEAKKDSELLSYMYKNLQKKLTTNQIELALELSRATYVVTTERIGRALELAYAVKAE